VAAPLYRSVLLRLHLNIVYVIACLGLKHVYIVYCLGNEIRLIFQMISTLFIGARSQGRHL
jgi:hypothetical protein